MEQRTKRRYTKEFKIEALNLAQQLGSYSAAAKQLGVSDSTMHGWRNKYGFTVSSAESRPAVQAVNESEEIKRLRRENEELKKTNQILKRAAAFFSQDHLK